MQIVLNLVARERLDNHPGAIFFQAAVHVRRSPRRVSHVVQAIKKRHQVVVTARIGFRHGQFKHDPVAHAGIFRTLLRSFNGFVVIIESREFRFWIMFGH